jgi:uncharacterized membrane protein (UPF0127 family)
MYVRCVAFAAILGCAALADTLVLKNGNTINGTYLGGDARTIRMTVGDRVESYQIADVANVSFGSGSDTPAPARSVEPKQTPPAAGSIELPAGTTLTVRMIDSVDSERDSLGQTFRASLDEAVIVNGDALIPRGNDVLLKLTDQKQSGKIEGKTSLTLDMVWVNVNGRNVDVHTGDVTQASSSRTARSGKVIGGTTALGAIIGGIAGGGKGAAIGGLAGAGAGTAAQVATKGQQVKIPSETRLTFTLEQPVRI